MKFLILILILMTMFGLLQVRLFKGDGSIIHVKNLQQQIRQQQMKNEQLKARNKTLEAEVGNLKNRMDAIEEHARTDLGMCREGETFYRIKRN